MRDAKTLMIYAGLYLIVATDTAHAYLDPGTGSILLQGLVAGIAGGLVIARLYWEKIKNFLHIGKKNAEEGEQNLKSPK